MTEDDKAQLEPYRCKHGCERDELKDRIEALIAENERLREALELADAALRGANMNMNVVERKISTALGETT